MNSACCTYTGPECRRLSTASKGAPARHFPEGTLGYYLLKSELRIAIYFQNVIAFLYNINRNDVLGDIVAITKANLELTTDPAPPGMQRFEMINEFQKNSK